MSQSNPQPYIKAAPQPAGLESYVFGKVQPQALPLEEAVLGAMLLDREALPLVMDVLRPESFYLEAHQLIFRACLSLFAASEPVDLLTVTERLRGAGHLEKIGGAYHLVELTSRVASSANLEYHARIVAQKHLQREMIALNTRTIKAAYEDTTDVFDMLQAHERDLFNLTHHKAGAQARHAGDFARESLLAIQRAGEQPSGLVGVPSGLTAIDEKNGGWRDGDLIILAARPGMGKSALALEIADNAASTGFPVGLFSLEMTGAQLIQRRQAARAGINGMRLNQGRLHEYEWQQLQAATEALFDVPLYIDDTPGLNIFDLRARARRMKMQYGIRLLVVDYLQLVHGQSGKKEQNRQQEVSDIARALKELAKEIGVPVIALAQLSRAVEIRGGSKRPQLSDLKESGGIEENADIVGFIYRPEYYQILEDEKGRSLKGVAELIIAKYRQGKLGTAFLRFDDTHARFSDLDAGMQWLNTGQQEPETPTSAATQYPTAKSPHPAPSLEAAPAYDTQAGIARMNELDIPF